jgi:hypothetical protein
MAIQEDLNLHSVAKHNRRLQLKIRALNTSAS